MNIDTGETMIDMPAAAQRLESKAREAGWTVTHRTAPTSIALRLTRGQERLVAVWTDGKFSSAWQKWQPNRHEGGVSPRRLNSRELSAAVASVPAVTA